MIDPISHALHRNAGKHGAVVLMYHSISSGRRSPKWPWAVSLRRFQEQLDFLAGEGWFTPTVSELISTPEKWSGRSAAITFDDGYVDNLVACNELISRGMRATWFIVSGSIGKKPTWSDDGRPACRMLDSGELRSMQAAKMEIGSHGVNHIRLTNTTDARLSNELKRSKSILEDLIDDSVNSFAYPYGDWDVRCEAAVKGAGYSQACTTRSGWARKDQDPYRLRRITIFNYDTAASFARKLALGTNDANWTSSLKYMATRVTNRLQRT